MTYMPEVGDKIDKNLGPCNTGGILSSSVVWDIPGYISKANLLLLRKSTTLIEL